MIIIIISAALLILIVSVLILKAKTKVKDPTENVNVLEEFKVSPEKVERIIEGMKNKMENDPDVEEGEYADLEESIIGVESMKDAYISENGYLCIEIYDKTDGFRGKSIYKISGISDIKKDDENYTLGFDDFTFTIKNKKDLIEIYKFDDWEKTTGRYGYIDDKQEYIFDVYEPSLYSALNYYKWHRTFESDR